MTTIMHKAGDRVVRVVDGAKGTVRTVTEHEEYGTDVIVDLDAGVDVLGVPSAFRRLGLLTMENGSTVLRADIATDKYGDVTGIVLAQTRDSEYVTWTVSQLYDGKYVAFWGNYFQGDDAFCHAVADYDERRKVAV